MSNIFKGANNKSENNKGINKNANNRFFSLIEEPNVKNTDNDNDKKPHIFTSSRNEYSRNSSNSFVDPKIQRERELKQKQLFEKEKNERELIIALNENNFTESLIKNKNLLTEKPIPINFLEKVKIAAIEKKEDTVVEISPDIDANNIIKHEYIAHKEPIFKVVLDNLAVLYKRQEFEERQRLGDEFYEEKYGINDENNMEYFDMLDELEEDSDSSSEYESEEEYYV